MDMAVQAAARGTCPRLRVGSVLVHDRRVISTGYNGSVISAPHCDTSGCIIENDHCQAVVHSEINALLSVARAGVSTLYTVMYVTHNPCLSCYKAMVNAGVKRIVYKDLYKQVDYDILKMSTNVKPEIVKYTP